MGKIFGQNLFEFISDEMKDILKGSDKTVPFLFISPACGAIIILILSSFNIFEPFFFSIFSLNIFVQFLLYFIIGLPVYLALNYKKWNRSK